VSDAERRDNTGERDAGLNNKEKEKKEKEGEDLQNYVYIQNEHLCRFSRRDIKVLP
jgi:hypothetical protein